MQLRPDQAQQIERARKLLDTPIEYEPMAMAGRIGKLEWYLSEMLRLIEGASE